MDVADNLTKHICFYVTIYYNVRLHETQQIHIWIAPSNILNLQALTFTEST